MIPVKREPGGEPPYEWCCFCFKPTPYWYVKKDVAVCTLCAKTHTVSEVPSKEVWCEQVRQHMAARRNPVGIRVMQRFRAEVIGLSDSSCARLVEIVNEEINRGKP